LAVQGWDVVFSGERLKADLVAAVLEANGIMVEVFGDNAYSYAINLTDARVLVPQDQAPEARRLISEAEAELPSQPDAQPEV
jgi:Putative prokaryotic signal transducing protein